MIKSTSEASDEMSQDGFSLLGRKTSGLSADGRSRLIIQRASDKTQSQQRYRPFCLDIISIFALEAQ